MPVPVPATNKVAAGLVKDKVKVIPGKKDKAAKPSKKNNVLWNTLVVVLVIFVAWQASNPKTLIGGLTFDALPRFKHYMQTFGPRFLDFTPPFPSFLRDGQIPTVLNVPWSQRFDFIIFRGPHYLKQAITSAIKGAWIALTNYKAQPVSDEQFSSYFSNTVMSKFLLLVDQVAIRPELKTTPETQYYLANFTFMKEIDTFPGFYCVGSEVYFKVDTTKAERVPVAINIRLIDKDGDRLIMSPKDRAWNGGKLFVLSGASHILAFVEHPRIHFPMDTVNAYTRHVPSYHVLSKILMPHMRFQLTLDDTVLNDYYLSVILNPWMPACPFDDPANQINKYLLEMKRGYKFNLEPIAKYNEFNYGIFYRRYYNVFYKFVDAAVKAEPKAFRDEAVQRWAENIHTVLNDFPGAENIVKGDTIVKVLAKIMFSLSVEHGVDHYTYNSLNWNTAPWRIRVPAPHTVDDEVDFAKVMKPVDMWKFVQSQYVFFYTGASSPLKEVNYGFESEKLRELNAKFAEDLQLADNIKEAHIADLAIIGPSIDY